MNIKRIKQMIGVILFLSINISVINAQSLAIVANNDGPPPQMTFKEIQSIFKGEKQRWKNNNRITLCMMKSNTNLGKLTASKIYQMSGDELNKFWLTLVFQGTVQAPRFFISQDELLRYVADNPGSIGVVDNTYNNNEVKLVTVDSKKSF